MTSWFILRIMMEDAPPLHADFWVLPHQATKYPLLRPAKPSSREIQRVGFVSPGNRSARTTVGTAPSQALRLGVIWLNQPNVKSPLQTTLIIPPGYIHERNLCGLVDLILEEKIILSTSYLNIATLRLLETASLGLVEGASFDFWELSMWVLLRYSIDLLL